MKDANEIEYEALNFDGLERRANYRTIAYREDMLHTFERRDAAAIIYQIIYRWQTEYKRDEILAEINRRKAARLAPLSPEEVEERMWVYMSYNDFVRESGQALGYNTVIRMLHYLVHDMKVIEQRENHDPHYPDYEYRINKITVKTLLKALPPEPAFHPKIPKKRDASTQMGTPTNNSTQEGIPDNQSTQIGTGSTQEGILTTQMGTEVYPNGGTSHITTHNYSHTDNTEESIGEQSDTATCAPSLSLDAPLSLSEIENESQQGDTHATAAPLHRPFGMAADQPVLPGEAIVASQPRTPSDLGASHGVQPVSERAVPTTRPVLEAAPEIDLDFLNAETEHRLPAIPKPPPGGTSHEQNRDASPRNVAVEVDLGVASSAPIPPVPSEVSPPRTMRATVVSPPPQVLVVSQQFTSVEDWKQAQEAFVEQLRGIWKTTSPDFKRQAGNWNAYRKQYLDRWLRANPEPTAESLLSPEERRIWQDWQTNYKGPIPLTASDKQALVMLLPINPSREELKAERGWLFSTDDPKKPWYRKIGVSLLDCAKNWSKWQSLQSIPQADSPKKQEGATLPPPMPSTEELKRMVY